MSLELSSSDLFTSLAVQSRSLLDEHMARSTFGRGYMSSDIHIGPRIDIPVILLALATGLVDAYTFPTLHVFTCNQTGNVVFLALTASQVHSDILNASRSAVSMCSFWFGAFVCGRLGSIVGDRKRIWLVTTLTMQGILVLIAAILIYAGTVDYLANTDLAVIMLLGVAFGTQGATVRPLKVAEVPSVVVTSAMIDLFRDADLFKRHNLPRDRRIAFIISLFLGAFIGGCVPEQSEWPAGSRHRGSFQATHCWRICLLAFSTRERGKDMRDVVFEWSLRTSIFKLAWSYKQITSMASVKPSLSSRNKVLWPLLRCHVIRSGYEVQEASIACIAGMSQQGLIGCCKVNQAPSVQMNGISDPKSSSLLPCNLMVHIYQ